MLSANNAILGVLPQFQRVPMAAGASPQPHGQPSSRPPPAPLRGHPNDALTSISGGAANFSLCCSPSLAARGGEAAAARLPAPGADLQPGATRSWPARPALPWWHRHGRCPPARGRAPLAGGVRTRGEPGDGGHSVGGKQGEGGRRARDATGHRCWPQGTHARTRLVHRRPHPLPVISLANWARQRRDPAARGEQQPPAHGPPSRAVPGSSAAQQVTPGLPQLSAGAQLPSRLPVSSTDLIKTRFHLPSTCQNEMLILICYAFDHSVVFQPRETSPRADSARRALTSPAPQQLHGKYRINHLEKKKII